MDKQWHDERRKGIGGSDASKIMAGEWYDLWLEKTQRREPDDLSDVLPVQIGIVTESLNRRWFEARTGHKVTLENCESLVHPDHNFARCNLDGRVDQALFEAKHVNAWAKEDEVLERYYPQLQHNLAVAQSDLIYLSIFLGTQKWESFTVEADSGYQKDLLIREAEFWRHVVEDTEPFDKPAEAVAISLDDMREIDFDGNNAWASGAADWLDNKDASKKFDAAAKGLKGLIDADVKLGTGHGVKVTRSKNGSLRIGAM